MATKAPAANGKTTIKLAKPQEPVGLQIPELEFREAWLTCKGISPLITHAWSEKSVKLMESRQQKTAGKQREARRPIDEWRAAAYVFPGTEHDWTDDEDVDWKPGRFCLPASAFKHVFLYGVSQLDDKTNVPKTKATGWFFALEDPKLEFSSVSLRTDIGRISGGTATPIYRPQFNDWSVTLGISFNAVTLTLEQAVALLDMGGQCGGIGEWRPSAPKNKSGNYGRFRVTGVER